VAIFEPDAVATIATIATEHFHNRFVVAKTAIVAVVKLQNNVEVETRKIAPILFLDFRSICWVINIHFHF